MKWPTDVLILAFTIKLIRYYMYSVVIKSLTVTSLEDSCEIQITHNNL